MLGLKVGRDSRGARLVSPCNLEVVAGWWRKFLTSVVEEVSGAVQEGKEANGAQLCVLRRQPMIP